jgi:ribokinase
MSKPIVVIGSINMDLVCRVENMPRPGETVQGTDFLTIPGGKGANQAVAAAKLAPKEIVVHMVGRVGGDDFGQRLLNGLRGHHVQTEFVAITESAASGVASILVNKKGENSIVVAAGANHALTIEDVDAAHDLIASAGAVVLQLEILPRVVLHVISLCQQLGVPTILDPAPVPAKGLSRAMMGVSILSPNQTESELLLGMPASHHVKRKGVNDPKQIGMELLARGPEAVVLKLGSKGAMILERDGRITKVKPFKVQVTDTTAAGDAFTGAMAVAKSEGADLPDAVLFANAAGALCCMGFGAQPSLPSREAVERLLKRGA